MYIVFQLPQGGTTTHALAVVRDTLYNWAAKYKVEYRTKIYKYTLRVTLDCDESYTLFGLTWISDSEYPDWTNYRIVRDLNNKV
jgi:hypothetical protein